MRKRRWLILVFALALVTLVVVLAVKGYREYSTAVAREITACRQAGMKLDRAALIPPSVPDDENAAVLYERAAALLDQTSKWPQDLRDAWARVRTLSPDVPWSQEERSDLHAVLEHLNELDPVLEQARSRPRCQLPVKYAGLLAEPPPVIRLLDLVRLRLLTAKLEADAGRYDEACLAVEDALRISESFGRHLVFIAWPARNVILSRAARQIEWLLAHEAISPPWRARLEARLPTRSELYAHMQQVVDGEATLMLDAARAAMGRHWDRLGVRGMTRTLRYLRQRWQWAAMPCHLCPEEMPDLEMDDKLAVVPALMTVHLPKSYYEQRDETVSRLEMLRLAFRIEQHKADRGSLPQRIDDILSPEKLQDYADPFTGPPYGYEPTQDGYRLWSAGKDRSDDGGRDRSDIVLRIAPGEPPSAASQQESTPAATEQGEPKPGPNWREYWQKKQREMQQRR